MLFKTTKKKTALATLLWGEGVLNSLASKVRDWFSISIS